MNMSNTTHITNVGRIDALIRFVIGISLIGLALSLDLGPMATFVLTALSVPTTLFALFRWDPLYRLLGIKTDTDYKLRA